MTERHYGCGRCIPVCPYDKISVHTYVRDAAAISELLRSEDDDEISPRLGYNDRILGGIRPNDHIHGGATLSNTLAESSNNRSGRDVTSSPANPIKPRWP